MNRIQKKSALVLEAANARRALLPIAESELLRARAVAQMLFETVSPTAEMVFGVYERTPYLDEEAEDIDEVVLADLEAAKQVAKAVFGLSGDLPETIFRCYDAIYPDDSDEDSDESLEDEED